MGLPRPSWSLFASRIAQRTKPQLQLPKFHQSSASFAFNCCSVNDRRTSPILHSNRFQSTYIKTDPIPVEKIRNVAIIAHVDHGKTTLVDALLRYSGLAVSNMRLLDQGDLEKEKGITILAKATRIEYKDHILNILDTPGHADFGGEVERVLSIVDGVVLVVDFCLGPMSQSRFVLSKALLNDKVIPIVVANKVDKGNGRQLGEIENEVFELFVGMDANDDQMEYPMLYGSAKFGWIENDFVNCKNTDHPLGMAPLLDKIIEHVPPPTLVEDSSSLDDFTATDKTSLQFAKNPISSDFAFLSTIVEHVPEIGYCVTGKVHKGFALKDSAIYILNPDAKSPIKSRIRDIYVTKGIDKVKTLIASTGDIVTLRFHGSVIPAVHDTLAASPTTPLLPFRKIDPPVIAVDVGPNTSPLQGKDGKLVSYVGTLHDLTLRLKREALINLAVAVKHNSSGAAITVHGRGDLQLSVLFETMRREGYEFEITPPQVLFHKDDQGKNLEPYERYTIVAPNTCNAKVLEAMAQREAEFIESHINGEYTQSVFECATRQFFGMHLLLNEITRGKSQITSEFLNYRPVRILKPPERKKQVLAMSPGSATAFDMLRFQNECRYFVEPNDPIYEGMILGCTTKSEDFYINICKGRKLVVVTIRQKDETVALTPSIRTSIEYCLAYIQVNNPFPQNEKHSHISQNDEIIEITPKRIAMRKKILSNEQRTKMARKLIKTKE